MKRNHLRKIIDVAWVTISIALILLWLRSFVHSRYQYPWESWGRLPWSQKLQPFVLTFNHHWIKSAATENGALPQVSEAEMKASVHAAADWLLSVQESSGHFKYWYDPVRDQFSPEGEDSFHRQACAAYSLVLVYEMSGDQRYLESAQRSLDYLLRFKKTLAPDKIYFLAENQADLGGAALPMLVMIKLRELTGTTVYDQDLQGLARFLVFLQQKYGTGEYKSTYVYRGNYEVEKELGWESAISPGQAMLALAWMHRNFHEPMYKDSIDRALQFYSKEKYWKQDAFLPWTLDAFVSMYVETGEVRYSDYATRLADYLISWQNLGSTGGAMGSFGAFPSVTTASYLEGLGDAVRLTQKNGDSAREAIYRQRAQMGYAWLASLQYRTSTTKALGGFALSRYDPQIRIDYTAHAISAFVRALR